MPGGWNGDGPAAPAAAASVSPFPRSPRPRDDLYARTMIEGAEKAHPRSAGRCTAAARTTVEGGTATQGRSRGYRRTRRGEGPSPDRPPPPRRGRYPGTPQPVRARTPNKPPTSHEERRQRGTVGGRQPTLQHEKRPGEGRKPPPDSRKLPLSPQALTRAPRVIRPYRRRDGDHSKSKTASG